MNRPTLAFDASHSACEHVCRYKEKPIVVEIFRTIQRYISAFDIPDPKTGLRYVPKCVECGCCLGRLHLCLECVYFGCRNGIGKGHIDKHFEETGHTLSIDIVHNYVYCHVCKDYKYDADLERIVYEQANYASAVKNQLGNPSEELVTYAEWKPDVHELEIMSANAKRQKVWEDSGFGLRGLNNLGNTCFMNCILQALLNNPLMRNFFLSDMHTEQTCPRKNPDLQGITRSDGAENLAKGAFFEASDGGELVSNEGGVHVRNGLGGNDGDAGVVSGQNGTSGGNVSLGSSVNGGVMNGAGALQNGAGGSVICLACEMHYLFQEVFSGEHKSYSPAQFLHSVWTHAHHLSGYEQQDAHEFFIACLDGMHLHSMGTKTNCQCFIHRIFTGHLRSDLKCLGCGNISTTVDPFWDISLDLKPSAIETSRGSGKKRDKDGTVKETEMYEPHSLLDCLKRFTRPESLGEDGKLFCKVCKSDQELTKQLSFEGLPIVICFHLKRFEHSTISSVKIDTRIKFPSKLDMSPYLSKSICKNGTASSSGMKQNAVPTFTVSNEELEDLTTNASDPSSPNRYMLYAVVNHHGKMDAGHYTAFVMRHNQWFDFDDDLVTKTTISDVLKSQGYLLFYIKEQIYYKKEDG